MPSRFDGLEAGALFNHLHGQAVDRGWRLQIGPAPDGAHWTALFLAGDETAGTVVRLSSEGSNRRAAMVALAEQLGVDP
jgi:hypothetical protein